MSENERVEKVVALLKEGYSCSQAVVCPKAVRAVAEILEEMLF